MIFNTNDKYQIMDYSENVLKYLNITKTEWKNMRENFGQEININAIINDFDKIIKHNDLDTTTSKHENISLVNTVVSLRLYDNLQEQFDATFKLYSFMNFFKQTYKT